ncbi:hypothetical protein C4901_15335 [Acidiferrobacter sp. SPIII_3]|jgi:hypothetical protein|uniref:hypothetical protein n=1 Tax=Acidiferrobacter sp. SPIII_3 TaxID=1281578 RepID=UPI000D72B686|nr:hypothetical protein [Acidiferrobacter sp. SPIII_3]AWP24529.1 hypothetical protein C4901_15335 [Acidiferrobacter sp. SPIII_3]
MNEQKAARKAYRESVARGIASLVHRSIQDYQQLAPATRAEVLALIRGRARRFAPPSPEVRRWWGGLPGLPRHNRVVFAAIKQAGGQHQ